MATQHHRAFTVAVVWTLLLLFLGSVVHATGSSLACPDWPTCFGTMVPEMTGGVFWEHLHRLVAGGLVLLWLVATWLVRREIPAHAGVFRACLAGIGLLVVQSVFGGLTVLLRLPDLVSTTHLALALLFLGLATALASLSAAPTEAHAVRPAVSSGILRWGAVATAFVFLQSVLGGLVRHTDAGMACPDAPLCLGRVIPPLGSPLVALHFAHRVVGVVAAAAVLWLAVWAIRAGAPARVRAWATWAGVLILVQVALGFLSVLTGLAVVPVSLHTLVAASTLAILVHVTAMGRTARVSAAPDPTPAAGR